MTALELINKVKYSKLLYNLYFRVGGDMLGIAKLFVRPEDKLIVFVSFGGKKYDDSPRCIYEKIIEDHRFDDYRLVWAFIEPDNHSIPRGEKIKIDTPKYFITLLKARCWVTNSGVERGLSFTGKNTFYLNTWHGTAIKKMGNDINSQTASFKSKARSSHVDVMLAQGQYDVDLFSRVFNIPADRFRITGLPRNDELVICNNQEVKASLKRKLGIPDNKKVILYAPTYREYSKDSGSNVVQRFPISFNKLKSALGDECVFLLRAHYEVLRVLDVKEDSFLRNVSSYPNLNELMLVSDVLVSDYSSIFFDYSILGRPMLCYAYDYQEYQDKRGLYFDVRDALKSNINNEEALVEELSKALSNPESFIPLTVSFRSKYVTEYGNASKASADIIYEAQTN